MAPVSAMIFLMGGGLPVRSTTKDYAPLKLDETLKNKDNKNILLKNKKLIQYFLDLPTGTKQK